MGDVDSRADPCSCPSQRVSFPVCPVLRAAWLPGPPQPRGLPLLAGAHPAHPRPQQAGDLALGLHVNTTYTDFPPLSVSIPGPYDEFALNVCPSTRTGRSHVGREMDPPGEEKSATPGTDPPGGRRLASRGPLHPPASTPPSSFPAAPDFPLHP